MTIDLHAHAIVPEALAEMVAAHPDFGPTLFSEDGTRYLSYPGRARLGPLPEAIFEPDIRLRDMDEKRVDVQIIAVPPPNYHYHVPAHVGVDFASIQNDFLIQLSDGQPDRFHVFGTLPLQDIDASLKEIERIAGIPRVRGVEMGTNINGVELDDPSLSPVWESLEAANLPVWLHPDQRSIAGPERLSDYYLQNFIGIPLDSTIAAARLIFGGVLERYPSLRFGFCHGGGFAPYQVGRWEHGWGVREEARTFVTDKGPRHYFSTLYFDSLTHDVISLQLLGQRVGWDHVVLGSDYPFDMASTDPVAGVEAAGLGEEEMKMVLEGNASHFLRPLGGSES